MKDDVNITGMHTTLDILRFAVFESEENKLRRNCTTLTK